MTLQSFKKGLTFVTSELLTIECIIPTAFVVRLSSVRENMELNSWIHYMTQWRLQKNSL